MLPSLEHIVQALITSAICFVFLWPFRKALGFAEHEVTDRYKKQRKQTIKQHVREEHPDKLKYCRQGQCEMLGTLSSTMAAE